MLVKIMKREYLREHPEGPKVQPPEECDSEELGTCMAATTAVTPTNSEKTRAVAKWLEVGLWVRHPRLCEMFALKGLEVLEAFLPVKPALCHLVCQCCANTILHLTVRMGAQRLLYRLLERGGYSVIVNARNTEGETALHLACGLGSLEMARGLLKAGADPNTPDNTGTLPLHLCVVRYQLRLAELLLNSGASVNALLSRRYRLTALHVAVARGSRGLTRLLIARGAHLDATDCRGLTALYHAASAGNEVCLAQLLEAGADLRIRFPRARTILHVACEANHEVCVRLLLEAGVQVNAIDENGMNGLHYAAKADCLGAVRMLIAYGCELEAKDAWQRSPLYLAVLEGRERVVMCLLGHGAAVGSNLATPLKRAIAANRRDLVRLLVERGVPVNTRDQFGKSILHAAVVHGDVALVRYLIDKGADMKTQGDLNGPLVSEAIAARNLEVVRLLVERGADVTTSDNLGRSPVFHATRSRCPEIIGILEATGIPEVLQEIKLYKKALEAHRKMPRLSCMCIEFNFE